MDLFSTPINSPILIILTIIYAVAAAITTFGIRIEQTKKDGGLPPGFREPPEWIWLFGYVLWFTWFVILMLNWKYALLLFFLKFVLKVLPVLEIVGEEIVRLFITKQSHEYKQLGKVLTKIYLGDGTFEEKWQHSTRLIDEATISDEEKDQALDVIKHLYSKESAKHSQNQTQSDQAQGSERYQKIVSSLQKIKQGNETIEEKYSISKLLIQTAGLQASEKQDLLDQLDMVYADEE